MEPEFKLYKRRWVIMVLFMMYAINGSAQAFQFSIISNLVMKYYEGITLTDIEWTVTGPMLAYVFLIFPSLYLLDKVGVRNMMIIGVTGITIGTWLKVFSIHRDRFYVVLFAQSLQAVFQVMTFGLCARFTAIWFGADEISIAGALALVGDQLGTTSTFLIPLIFVTDGTPEVIGRGLQKMHWFHSGVSTVALLMIVLFFKSAPKHPPSAAQAKQRQCEKQSLFQAVKSIMKKPSFILISLSYSLCVGSFTAAVGLINQTFLANFPNHTADEAGNIAIIFTLSGMFFSLITGKILDKTRKFKESAVLLTTCSSIAFMAFTWALKSGHIFNLYIVAVFMGCFCQSYYGTGFQMAIEVTYPVSEEISSAMLLLFNQFITFLITFIYGYSIKKYGDLASNVGIIVIILISVLCALLIPSNLKRQLVEKSARDETDKDELRRLRSSKT